VTLSTTKMATFAKLKLEKSIKKFLKKKKLPPHLKGGFYIVLNFKIVKYTIMLNMNLLNGLIN
jgi:hypothetical protein